MTRLDALRALYETVKARDDFVIHDDWIEAWDVAFPELQTYQMKSDGKSVAILTANAMLGSVDAALAFIAATLPGWAVCGLCEIRAENYWIASLASNEGRRTDRADHPATALLLAGLAAHIAMEEGK